MRYLTAIITLLAMSASASAATVTARPGQQGQKDVTKPYRNAEISVTNTSDRIIRAISVRAVQGGPTMLKPITIAPKTGQKVFIDLPAFSQEQTYTVSLYTDEKAQTQLDPARKIRINWPVESVNAGAFIDLPCYREQFETLPDWPRRLRVGLVIAASLMGIALGGIMFIRKGAVRGVLLILTVAAAAIVMWQVSATYKSVIVTTDETGRDVIVKCRRTSQWTTEDKTLVPIYYSKAHLAEDNAVISGDGISVTIKPNEVRIFRRW